MKNSIKHHSDCTYISNYKLKSHDLILISNAAEELAYFDGQVRWLVASLDKAKEESNWSNVRMIRYRAQLLQEILFLKFRYRDRYRVRNDFE